MKVVKHLVCCVWHWYGINLDWVYSLNHRTSPSFVAQELPRFLDDIPKLCQQGLLECCKDTSICTSTAYEGCQTPCMQWCGINLDWVYSLNQCTSPSFVAQELPSFLGEFPKLSQQEGLNRCKDTSIFTSTAYEGCQTPCMYLTLMWDQSWLGLQPQSLHFTIICLLGDFPKPLSAGAAGMLLKHIHMHIHCI